jgi:hypothetical protein
LCDSKYADAKYDTMWILSMRVFGYLDTKW